MILFLFGMVALQLAVGLWAASRIRTEDDFLVAGRRMGPALAGASIFATWFGAESCVAAAGTAYEEGVGWHSTEPFAYGLCLVLLGLFFAARLWKLGITTLPDLFGSRFGRSTERLAAVLLLPSSLFWAAAQIHAFGDVVAVNSDGSISPTVGIAIAAGLAIVYTVSGGLMADVYTDVLQATILIGGLLALLVSVLLALPEAPAQAVATAVATPQAGAPPLLDMIEAWAIPILGSIVAQEAISRTLAARSAGTARNSALLGGSIYLLVGAIPLTIGLLGPRLLPDLADPEAILPTLSKEHLPTWLNFVFAGALIAAILSTVDSCLLVVSSIAVRNLAPHGNDQSRGRLRAARVAVVLAGLVAYGLANTDWDVGDLVEQASGFGSAGVFVLAVLATRGRVGGPIAANGALLGGAGCWVLGRYLAPDAFDHPYLASLAAAAGGFVLGAGVERLRRRHA